MKEFLSKNTTDLGNYIKQANTSEQMLTSTNLDKLLKMQNKADNVRPRLDAHKKEVRPSQ